MRRATNIHWQSVDVDKQARAGQKHQRPSVLWFTGLSGSGKSTIANIVEQKPNFLVIIIFENNVFNTGARVCSVGSQLEQAGWNPGVVFYMHFHMK